ncbi:MAG: tryptophan--tRNA ligase [bacterium]|nr:tryptophan--tRNA ligase [bacterium]MDN5835437.1 tryptophan--tRNA ligase [bacterium]
MTKPVILTGLRANNNLTIGNYFGAIEPIVRMARDKSVDYQINMFIPDLHSFTTPIDHGELYEQTLNNARVYAAAGLPLDNNDIHLYRQSFVPAHSEMTWILDCFTGIGEMGRMTQFKDKSSNAQDDRVSVGLFNYPVLMASDILLYDATYVPVGDDQTQHLEFTRDIAERINQQFDQNIFTVPLATKEQLAFFDAEHGLRIMDLADPTKKMSKSTESDRGVVFLTDSAEDAHKKIMSATTDNLASVAYDTTNQPGISNLLEILSQVRNQPLGTTLLEFQGMERYGDFKRIVADEVAAFLTQFQAQLAFVDGSAVESKLLKSEAAMRDQAGKTLYRLQAAAGLRK